MESGPNTEPLNKLPPDPKGPSGDFSGFLKMMGITIGAAGVVLAAGAIIVNLSPAQEDLTQRLHSDYGSSGLSLDDIRAIIADHPNLKEADLRKLLDRYKQVTKAYPNLVNNHGALQVFIEFIALAAYDPAHGGNYSTRQPADMDRLYKGIIEAEVEMGVMEDGKIPWLLTPSPVEAYEATDPNGNKWDVKGFYSIDPGGKPFNLTTAMKKLEKEIIKNGENIILDDRNMTPEDIWKLHEALKSKGWDGNVVWWPNDPVKPGP